MARACPSCSASIPFRMESSLLEAARCPSCGALVDLRSNATPPRQIAPLAVPVPEGWRVDTPAGVVCVRWRWFKASGLIMIPFAAFWNGILAFMAFGVTQGGKHPERLLVGLLVPHVWIGIGLLYAIAANLLNSTTVEIGPKLVRVHHGPLPWRGNANVIADDVVQPFVSMHRGKSTTYDVCAVMRDGRRQVLVRGLELEDQARYLEHQIEEQLGIEDRAVQGELRRDAV